MRRRLATFNVALARREPGALRDELAAGSNQARALARIIRYCQPDVLVINEFDHDPDGDALNRFHDDYLAAQGDPATPPVCYGHRYAGAVNTGVPSGYDLDGDGDPSGPGDALGFGRFPGQYGMAVLARDPIETTGIRTFRDFPWASLPGAVLPRTADGGHWFPPGLRETQPLSSKSHWDIPLVIGGRRLHCLVSHPTPPAFDGPERRNRRRNRDELRFWQRYLADDATLVDDAGHTGGLATDAWCAVMGDLNADPEDGAGDATAIRGLLEHPRLQDAQPRSAGGRQWHHHQPRPARGDPACLTGWFGCFGLRLDYVLPDARLGVSASGIFWPPPDSRRAGWIGTPDHQTASDHRLVWVDVVFPD